MGYLAQLSIQRSVPQAKAEIEPISRRTLEVWHRTFNLPILMVIWSFCSWLAFAGEEVSGVWGPRTAITIINYERCHVTAYHSKESVKGASSNYFFPKRTSLWRLGGGGRPLDVTKVQVKMSTLLGTAACQTRGAMACHVKFGPP